MRIIKILASILVFLLIVACQNFKMDNKNDHLQNNIANNAKDKEIKSVEAPKKNIDAPKDVDHNVPINANSPTDLNAIVEQQDNFSTPNDKSIKHESVNVVPRDNKTNASIEVKKESTSSSSANSSTANSSEGTSKLENSTHSQDSSPQEDVAYEEDAQEDTIYEEESSSEEESSFEENSMEAEENEAGSTTDYSAQKLEEERLAKERQREQEHLAEMRKKEELRLAEERRVEEANRNKEEAAKNRFWNSLKEKRGTYVYDFYVDKTKYGAQTITIALKGQDLVISNNVNVDASTWYYTYKYKQQDTEIWRDGQLLSYSCFIDDNGTKRQVSVTEGNSGYIVKASNTSSAKSPLATGVSWNLLEMLEEYPSFSYIDGTKEGQIVVYSKSNLNVLGEENIKAAGQNILCKHLRPSSKEWDVWYNSDKILVRSTSTSEGSFYDIVLSSIKK